MRRSVLAGIALLGGCYRPALEAACTVSCDDGVTCPGDLQCGANHRCHAPGVDSCPAGGEIDAAIDSPPPGTTCYGHGLFTYCTNAPPTSGAFTLPGFIDTTAATDCVVVTTNGHEACLIFAGTVVNNQPVRAEGIRPLAIVAVQGIELVEDLDVASHVMGPPGAGANPSACNPPMPPGDGSGGAGGTFHGGGGAGGTNASTAAGSPGGPPELFFHGGCDGGSADVTGERGRGGGAVYLIAGESIAIDSGVRVDASGGGAIHGVRGGPGGGSGGMIGLDAPAISISGVLMAEGGGGASGDTASLGHDGSDPPGPQIGGAGGTNTAGGSGGQGAGAGVLDGSPGDDANAGGLAGGGGGGAGWIVIYPNTPPATASIAPPAQAP